MILPETGKIFPGVSVLLRWEKTFFPASISFSSTQINFNISNHTVQNNQIYVPHKENKLHRLQLTVQDVENIIQQSGRIVQNEEKIFQISGITIQSAEKTVQNLKNSVHRAGEILHNIELTTFQKERDQDGDSMGFDFT